MRGIIAVAIAFQVASVTMPSYPEDIQGQLLPPQPSLHFHLGERLTNLACLVKSSIVEVTRALLKPLARCDRNLDTA